MQIFLKYSILLFLLLSPLYSFSENDLLNNDSNLNERFAKNIKYSTDSPNLIGYIAIDDKSEAISQSTWIYVKNALDYYKKNKPIFIILKLNTPGGEVFAAQKISDALKEIDLQYEIPVVAFIDDWAISAGAMLAYSCRFITTVKSGIMGAAEPVIVGQDGQMQSASEKVNSALRVDFANRASFFDRNPDIAEAMVDKDVILVLRHGKILQLSSKEEIRLKDPDPDIIISNESKLLTLNGEKMLAYGVADLVLTPEKGDPVTSQERSEGVWPFSKELLSKNVFFKKIPNATVDAYKMDWKIRFFAFLASPVVSSLLMLGLFLGIYFELSSPGFGLPGGVAVSCLCLIVMSSLSLENGNLLEVILILVGLGLIVIEFSLYHTGGILAFVGGLFFIGGLFAVMLPGISLIDFELSSGELTAAGEEFLKRLAWLCGTIVVSFVMIIIFSQYITPSFRGLKRLVLSGREEESREGFISGDDPNLLPQPGSKGQVFSTLRPSGKVLINNNIYDAVTPGSFIEKGERIIVEQLDGSVIVVNKVEEETQNSG